MHLIYPLRQSVFLSYKFANIYAYTHIYIYTHIVLVNPCNPPPPKSLLSWTSRVMVGGSVDDTFLWRQVSAFLRLVSLEPQSPWCLTNSSTNGKLQGNYGLIFINLVLMMGIYIYIYVNFNLYHIDHMGWYMLTLKGTCWKTYNYEW